MNIVTKPYQNLILLFFFFTSEIDVKPVFIEYKYTTQYVKSIYFTRFNDKLKL